MKNQALNQPIIGITTNLYPIETGCFKGRDRIGINHDYIQAIEKASGVPLVLPIVRSKIAIQRQAELIDGLILSGGDDVSPLYYGEEPHSHLDTFCPERDHHELELIRAVFQLGKPIFGICRGLQLLNVAFGGTLHQDIPQALPQSLQHTQKARPDDATHTVDLMPGTFLHRLFGETQLLTNSFHHQAIKEIAPQFTINAYTKDGLIEGFEREEPSFILGVQWHPETMIIKHPQMQKLFDALIQAVRRSMVV